MYVCMHVSMNGKENYIEVMYDVSTYSAAYMISLYKH